MFVNIVIDCSFGQQKFYEKQYSVLEQVLITVRSIQRNWTFPHSINLIYCSDVDEKTRVTLEGLGIELYQVEPDFVGSSFCGEYRLARSQSYTLPLRKPGTHRLILDCDMIAVNDFGEQLAKLSEYDVAAMYEFDTNIVGRQREYDYMVKFLRRRFGLKCPTKPFRYSKDNHLANDYHLSGRHLECPYYNPIFLMREEWVVEFGGYYKSFWALMDDREFEGYHRRSTSAAGPWFVQVAMSMTLQHLGMNVGIFPPGVNMLPLTATRSDKFRNFDNTYLLHCCGSTYFFISEMCDFYLDGKGDYQPELYYREMTRKHLRAEEVLGKRIDY